MTRNRPANRSTPPPIPSVRVRLIGPDEELKARAREVIHHALLASGFTDRDPNPPHLYVVPDPPSGYATTDTPLPDPSDMEATP